MIIRGTTPRIRFTFKDVDPTDMANAYLTMKQGDVVIEYDVADTIDITTSELVWVLTQEDTLSFVSGKSPVKIQCRYRMNNGEAGASKIYEHDVYGVLKAGEI